MKLLNGAELANFIKEQQAHQVRGLRQSQSISPKLVVIQAAKDPVIDLYVRLKKAYGEDISVEVEVWELEQMVVAEHIKRFNNDSLVHGIILQLPLSDTSQTEVLCNLISPEKDVDALGLKPKFDAATPTAIMWLLAGYNISLPGKNILVVGQGKLVGAPLVALLQSSGIEPIVADKSTPDLARLTEVADIIITATGQPGLIKSDMIRRDAIIIDAGTAGEQGAIVGDLAPEVYDMPNLTITPQKGGVGPLTISALFSNVIRSARSAVQELKE